jgi:glycosyltransferase involved in cell wall biosynthesis
MTVQLRIAFFTPLAPRQTAIADHSEGLLPYLSQGADIDLFIDEGYEPTTPAIAEQFNIYSYREFPQRAANYDLPVYAMGNDNRFHGFMHNLMRDYPGVVIFHDTDFQHYFVERTLQHDDVGDYLSEMEYAYGQTGRQVAVLALIGEVERLRGVFPLIERLLAWSRGGIVYNEFAFRDLRRRRPEARLRHLNHHFYTPPGFPAKVDVEALRRRWGVQDAFTLGTFGLFIPHKRIEVCLRVFRRFLEVQPNAHYLLVGQHSPFYDVPEMIRAHELEDRVTLTGWMDALEFTQYLCVPDVVIHLRYPHIGGTPYTPIRLLGLGQPTILSDIEPLAGFPEGCCTKILPDEYEEDTLLAILKRLAEDADLRRQMGENARRFVARQHDVEQIAREHLEFFAEVVATPAPAKEPATKTWQDRLVRDSASVLASWGVTEKDEYLLAPISQAIGELFPLPAEEQS